MGKVPLQFALRPNPISWILYKSETILKIATYIAICDGLLRITRLGFVLYAQDHCQKLELGCDA